ncbi:MAG: hypothetical protein V2J26_06115 [Pacificimonas sp.]|jgi:rod shape-determining protein MreD|nr:hypothetical protein [Pacificimonas sp.]
MAREGRPFNTLSTGEQLAVVLAGTLGIIPPLIVAIGFLILTVPFFPPIALMPNMGLVLVFLFALYRPRQLPVWMGVPLGLWADVLLGMPFGANGFALPLFMLAVQWFDTHTRRMHWSMDWLVAVPFLLGYKSFLWLICVTIGPSAPLVPFLSQGLATLAVFPLVAFLFVSIQRRFVDRISA